jgi:hypothetical protein
LAVGFSNAFLLAVIAEPILSHDFLSKFYLLVESFLHKVLKAVFPKLLAAPSIMSHQTSFTAVVCNIVPVVCLLFLGSLPLLAMKSVVLTPIMVFTTTLRQWGTLFLLKLGDWIRKNCVFAEAEFSAPPGLHYCI